MKKLSTIFVNIIFVFFPLLIALGPFIADLGVVIIAIYFLASTIVNKEYKLYSSNIFKIILLFWIYCIFLSLISSNILLSLESSLFYGRFIFFAMGIALILQNNRKLVDFFLIVLVISITLISLDALFQSIYDVNLLGMEKKHTTRVSGVFQDELILGSYLSRLFPLIFLTFPIFFFKKNNQLNSFLRIFLIVLVGCVIYNAGERSAFGYFFIGLILIFLFIPIYRKTLIYSFLVLLFSLILISFFQPDVQKRMFNVTIKNLGAGFEEHNRIYMFSEQHEAHYIVAFEMFIDKIVFGHGPKLFREICKNYDDFGCSTHPHNTYMQLLSETGLIGFGIFLSIFLYICFYFIKHGIKVVTNEKIDHEYNKIIILITIFISLFPIIPTGSFFGNWLNTIYYIPVGLLLFFNFSIRKN